MRLALLVPLLALLLPGAQAALLAIDYGAEFTKISLVKPGVPIDVVLNKDSKRKVQSIVGWKKDERLFGAEAAAVSGRYPYDSFPYLKPLLGAAPDDQHNILFPSLIHPSNRSLEFTLGTNPKTHYSVEELVGMQFAYARELGEHMAGEKIGEAVIVVPGWWGQRERQAVKDAAEIGGLRSVDLINDATAIGMNFAMTRSFPTKEYHLIYDSGALSTSATLLSFHTFPAVPASPFIGKTSKYTPAKVNTTHVEVLGLGWNDALGGQGLDALIKEHLVKEFEAKLGKPMQEGADETFKALGKIGKEAARVKAILSANNDAAVGIESLYNDIDFRTRISREQLETAASDWITSGAFSQPIADALAMANLTVADINSLILFGGNSRVPMVRAAVRDFVTEDKIAQNVNTDEAATLGAAFYGATQSRQFKTKEYRVGDITPFAVGLSYEGEQGSTQSKLFEVGDKIGKGNQRALKFKKDADFPLTLRYTSAPEDDIFGVRISGLSAAVESLMVNSTAPPATPDVRIVALYDDSGLLQVTDATATFATVSNATAEDKGLGGKLKGLFGGKEDAKKDGNATEEVAAAADKVENKDVVKKLSVQITYDKVPPLTWEEKRASRAKLLAIDALELSRRQREEALNHLEGYLYRLRDLLAPENEGSVFWQFSQEQEREKLGEGVREGMAWLEEEGWKADTASLRKRADDLAAIEKPAQFRNTEARNRAKSVEDFQKALYAGRVFLQSAKQNQTEDVEAGRTPKYTEDEIDGVHLHMIGMEEWFGSKADVQKDLAPNQDPVVTTAEIDERGKAFQDKVLKLIKRKAAAQPKPVVVKKAAEEASNNETKTEEAEEPVPAEDPAGGNEEEAVEAEKPEATHKKDEL